MFNPILTEEIDLGLSKYLVKHGFKGNEIKEIITIYTNLWKYDIVFKGVGRKERIERAIKIYLDNLSCKAV
jgi:hypothetical protein